MAKSSSEILNELFNTFNTSFDEREALALLDSSLSSRNKKKKKKKEKEKDKVKVKDRKEKLKKKSSPEKKDKDKEKSKSNSRKYSSKTHKSRSPKGKSKKGIFEEIDEQEYEVKLDVDTSSSPPAAKSVYKATKLVLDIEEGEILEDVNADNDDSPPRQIKHHTGPPFNIDDDLVCPKLKKRKRSHSHRDDMVDISRDDFFRRGREFSSKSSRKSEIELEKHVDDFIEAPHTSNSKSKSRRGHHSPDIETRRSRRTGSDSPRDERHSESFRIRREESPISRRVGQTSSGIVWRVPEAERERERGRDHERDRSNVEKSLYFADARGNDDRNSRVYRNPRSRSRTRRNSGGHDNRRGSFSRSWEDRSHRRSRSRSFSRSRSSRNRHPDDIIDKAKLLEIARHNAAKLMKTGVLPSDIFSRDQIIAIRAGGKSVDELTSYCQRLAKREAMGIEDMSSDSGDEGERGDFIHHPFVVKDRPMPSITMNIRNAIPLPVRSAQELAIENAKLKVQFPVSSGTQHRLELEWKPVEKDDETEGTAAADDKSLVPLGSVPVGTVAPMPQIQDIPLPVPPPSTSGPLAIMPPPDPPKPVKLDPPKPTSGIKFDPPPTPNLDIGAIISVRLRAMRRLQQDPDDAEAKSQLEEATQEMKSWAELKALEPKFLSAAEITGGPQAWAKKDQLKNATALSGGMGMHLLQRMGWRPGEGLGKNKEGGTEPLALDVKTDKKGLSASTEGKLGKDRPPSLPMIYDLSGKHPVSALMELCVKRKWGPPNFELCFEHGPPHKKQFVFKVIVNGVEYQPCVATNNKKMAKTNSAAFCLQSLGLLPTAEAPSSAETLRTVPDKPSDIAAMPPPPPPPPPPVALNQPGTSRQGNAQLRNFISSHTLQTVLPNSK